MFSNILASMPLLFSPYNLLAVLFGTVAGIVFGSLPGFTASMGIAVLIPVTFGMDPATGLIMLGGVYCGGIYGGSISAVLLRTPGTDASALTAIDGFELTKQGRGREGLTESAVASWWGGIFSAIVLLFFAPILSQVSLLFGPFENLMLAVFGMSIIALVCSDSFLMGLIGGLIGLLIGTIGIDPVYGNDRFTFGITALLSGVALVPALIGLFSISQLMMMAKSNMNKILSVNSREALGDSRVSLADFVRYPWVYLRSSIIGTLVGIVPAAGTTIATFLSYNEGKRRSKEKELYGKGSREAIACIEAANNAVTGGSLVPTLTLGIPGNSVTAILMGGLMIQGLTPGYSLFTAQAHITYPFILSLFLANTIFLLIGLFGAYYFSKIVTAPVNVLIACISVMCVMGTFALRSTMTDVYTMLIFGVVGYVFRIIGIEPIPIILGMILGPIGDRALTQSLVLSRNSSLFSAMFSRPICIVLGLLTLATVLLPVWQYYKKKSGTAAGVLA